MQHGIPKPCECGSLNLKLLEDDTGKRRFVFCLECGTEAPSATTERQAWAEWCAE